jgi:hypothetical protein
MEQKTVRPLVLFIDLEGLGTPKKIGDQIRNIEWLFDLLPVALRAQGFKLQEAITFAAFRGRRKKEVSRIRQTRVRTALARYGAEMHWSETIADTALIREVERRLAKSKFPEAVMLITNDGGFAPLVLRLRERADTSCSFPDRQ